MKLLLFKYVMHIKDEKYLLIAGKRNSFCVIPLRISIFGNFPLLNRHVGSSVKNLSCPKSRSTMGLNRMIGLVTANSNISGTVFEKSSLVAYCRKFSFFQFLFFSIIFFNYFFFQLTFCKHSIILLTDSSEQFNKRACFLAKSNWSDGIDHCALADPLIIMTR